MVVEFTPVRLFFMVDFSTENFLTREVQWDGSGIAVFFFQRGVVPPDISAGSPDSSGWGTPMARWPATACNPFQFFKQHSVIFDTTLW
jgi:hypothetical protein